MKTPLDAVICNARPKFLHGIIKEVLGSTNLNFVLDAADLTSYDGSSQTWTDVVGGNNMFRGTTSGADASDPTFNGTAGQPTESTYFSVDGGDWFKETAAHTFDDNWHKNNGAFTVLAVVYMTNTATIRGIWSNGAIGVSPGVNLRVSATETVTLRHSTADATVEALVSAATVPTDAWSMLAMTFDEATTAASIIINATAEAFVPTASTATAASGNIRIGAESDTPDQPMASGERIACVAGWSTKVSDANIALIYNRLKSRRFTSLP